MSRARTSKPRDYARSASAQRRLRLQAAGRCIDCEVTCGTQRCRDCRLRVEANTHRNRGQGKRGGRPRAVADVGDVDMALRELAAARTVLAAAYTVPKEDRLRRRDAIAGALAKVTLAGRMCLDLAARRGVE